MVMREANRDHAPEPGRTDKAANIVTGSPNIASNARLASLGGAGTVPVIGGMSAV